MIAATRDTSTRSTPTPIAVMGARPRPPGSEAEPSREPRGSGEVAAYHQAQPHEHHRERRPHGDQRPERRPPAAYGVDLRGPLAPLVFDLCLEGEPRRLEPARGGAERFLPLGVRALVEH